VLPQCIVSEPIQLAGPHIRLELAIPDLGIVLRKSSPQGLELLGSEFFDLTFNLLDTAHCAPINSV